MIVYIDFKIINFISLFEIQTNDKYKIHFLHLISWHICLDLWVFYILRITSSRFKSDPFPGILYRKYYYCSYFRFLNPKYNVHNHIVWHSNEFLRLSSENKQYILVYASDPESKAINSLVGPRCMPVFLS